MMDQSSPHIELIPTTQDQEPVLANLLELYAHDYSEFQHLELRENGRFGYPDLPLYWLEPNRYPFLVRMNGKLAGLVLVKRGSEISGDELIWDMKEFFIVRAYRRRSIGSVIAHQVWRRFPGEWEVRVRETNHAAHRFWGRAISTFVGEPVRSVLVEKNNKLWRVFSFRAEPAKKSLVNG
jgi:predicted acetyltransferase